MNESTDIDKLIEDVERLDREATEGPWEWVDPERGIMAHDEMPEVLEHPSHRGLFLKPVIGASAYPGQQGKLFVVEQDRALVTTYRTAAPLLAAEVKRLRAELEDESKSADLHRRLNERVASALGLLDVRTDPETGEEHLPSWHDMPEQVAALVAEKEEQKGAPYNDPDRVRVMVNAERIRRGLSWRDLANVLDMAPSGLTRWNQGKMLNVPAYLRVCDWLQAADKAGSPS